MLGHYLKIAWRNLKRASIFSFINITGLTIGLTCSILILLFVKDELSFDKFHSQGQNIYRITMQNKVEGKVGNSSITGSTEGPRFTANVPGIKSFIRFNQAGTNIKTRDGVQPLQLFRTDSNFFEVFSFPLIAGNPATCLKDPHGIVLSKDEAIRQFGTTDVIGKPVQLFEDTAFTPYKVTAVAKNSPENSSIRFAALAPMNITPADEQNPENWFSQYLNTFVLLDRNANPKQVEEAMQRFFTKDASIAFQTLLKKFGIPATKISMPIYHLQPYTKMHLDKDIHSGNGIVGSTSINNSYILSAIALFILLIACINFINLNTARSIKRSKEIGIRKVIGSTKKQLIRQFMGESTLLCIVAFLLALILSLAVLPLFNTLSGKSLSLSYLWDGKLAVALITLLLLTSFIAGFYPALVLTKYDPSKILYNRFQPAGKNYFQKSLIVLQFTMAAFLVALTFILYQQFSYITKADLGYDDSNLVRVEQFSDHSRGQLFTDLLSADPHIQEVAVKNSGNRSTIGKIAGGTVLHFRLDAITSNYLDELRIPILSGRNFSTSNVTDSSTKILVNEAFVKKAGWQNPLGQKVTFTTMDNKIMEVIGVVKNYHYGSLNEQIEPQIFQWEDVNNLNSFYIKIKPGQSPQALAAIKNTFQQVYPLSPYSYNFVAEANKQQYGDLDKWRQILFFGGLITILVSFMGLFGLSVLSSERRKKEIGIRKVYGASVRGIIRLLTTDYLKLVLLALAIATPVTIIVAHKFLQTMLYRIKLTPLLLIVPDILIIILAFLTIFLQTRQSAITNPVKSLRND